MRSVPHETNQAYNLMSDTASQTLLPEGLRDVLSPDAAREAAVVETLSSCFEANGYERVSPPLVEFESTLLSGMGRCDSRSNISDG